MRNVAGYKLHFSGYLLLKLLYLLLTIDTLNGFCLFYGYPAPFGILFKSLIIVTCVVYLARTKTHLYKTVFPILMSAIYLAHIVVNTNSSIGETLNFLFKFLTVYFCFYAISDIIKKNNRGIVQRIPNIVAINSIILLLNIYSGLIGIGGYAYNGMLGCKGFIYSHNEMSGLLAVLCTLSYCVFFKQIQLKKVYIILYSGIFFLAALLLSTKASILLVCFSLMIVPFSLKKKQKFYLKRYLKAKWIISFFIVLIILSVGIYYAYQLLLSTGAVDRWMFFFDRDGSAAVFSGRDEFWAEEKDEWLENGIMIFLFGLGGSRTVEMDQCDALLNMGLVGTFFVYMFYLSLLLKSFRRRRSSPYGNLVFRMDTLIILASCYAGHLLFSGLMGVHFALMNSMIYQKKIIEP